MPNDPAIWKISTYLAKKKGFHSFKAGSAGDKASKRIAESDQPRAIKRHSASRYGFHK